MPDPRQAPWRERFWRYVDKREDGGCWLWTGATNNKGYPQLRVDGKSVLAHRLSWRLHHGYELGNMMICHRCDTPNCVNPAHLFIGTAAQNAADMVRKGRHRSSGLRGEQIATSVLTERDVAEIKRLYRWHDRECGTTGLARRYGVSATVVHNIVTGRSWRHVE